MQALGQLVKAGNDAPNGTMTATAFTLDLSSGDPTSTRRRPARPGWRAKRWPSWGSFDHLFDSIGHALRHGAMELKNAVIKLAEDGKSWLVDLVVQIGCDIWTAADLAITDMKHAFHVIGGFFNALGADIKSAVQWLWHDIVAFLKDVKTTADQLQTWITDLGGEVTTALTTIKIDTDNWFTAKEPQATDAITYMKNHAEGTLGSPRFPRRRTTPAAAASQSKLLKDLGEIAKVMNDAPGKWLLDKFLSYLPVTDTGPVIKPEHLRTLAAAAGQGLGRRHDLLPEPVHLHRDHVVGRVQQRRGRGQERADQHPAHHLVHRSRRHRRERTDAAGRHRRHGVSTSRSPESPWPRTTSPTPTTSSGTWA